MTSPRSVYPLSSTILGTELPVSFDGTRTPFTLCTLIRPQVDGFLTGFRLCLDDADEDVHPLMLWNAGDVNSKGVWIWRGKRATSVSFGSGVTSHNAWIHNQYRVNGGSLYYLGALYPSGAYWYTLSRFASGVIGDQVDAPADGTAGLSNGASHGGCVPQYPANTFMSTWYGVDALFRPKT